MAEHQNPKAPNVPFTGMDQIVGISADAYVVAHSTDGTFTLYFFQSQLPPLGDGKFHAGNAGNKCVSRVTLSEITFQLLLKTMSDDAGFTLTRNNGGDE